MVLLLGGCATQQAGQRAISNPPRTVDGRAMALIFDPPVTRGLPPIDLPRAPRASAAFGGYNDLITTYLSIYTVDQQSSDWSDRYQRRTEMGRVGVSYR